MNFGDTVKKLRKEMKYSQIKLSQMTAIPQTTISDLERGRITANIIHLQKIAKALNVTASELLESDKPA